MQNIIIISINSRKTLFPSWIWVPFRHIMYTKASAVPLLFVPIWINESRWQLVVEAGQLGSLGFQTWPGCHLSWAWSRGTEYRFDPMETSSWTTSSSHDLRHSKGQDLFMEATIHPRSMEYYEAVHDCMNSKDGPVDLQQMDRNSSLAPLLFARNQKMAQLRPFQDDQPLRTATLFRFDFEKPEWTGAIEIVS